MVYFTADNHFGHENILKLCKRPFSSVDEMNAKMIEKWNTKVKSKDIVYIIGDMFYRAADPEAVLRQLSGVKYLVIGNHDKDWMKNTELTKYFAGIENIIYLRDNHRQLTLCHYPFMTWRGAESNGYMIYGHIHADKDAPYWELIRSSDRMLNAGVDVNGFSPVTLDEMAENNRLHRLAP